jgi:hypothetical protein
MNAAKVVYQIAWSGRIEKWWPTIKAGNIKVE